MRFFLLKRKLLLLFKDEEFYSNTFLYRIIEKEHTNFSVFLVYGESHL